MKAIETTLTVSPDGSVRVDALPDEVRPGEHRAIIFVESNATAPRGRRTRPIRLPVHDGDPWPEGFRVSRDELYDE